MLGFLLIDKPQACTSHDVVARLRRLSNLRRIGHAGTLDPAATGLLVMALGGATRLLEYLVGLDKTYQCAGRLGWTSTTDDAEGELRAVEGARPLPRETLEAALDSWRGEIMQRPPAFSAIKVKGRKLYELARRGEAVEAAPRKVTAHELQCTSFNWPDFELTMRVSSGFYVRALVRDLGERLGQGAYVTALRRTAIGTHRVEDAVQLAELEKQPSLMRERLIDVCKMLGHFPLVALNQEQETRIRNGNTVTVDEAQLTVRMDERLEPLLIVDPDGQVLAIGSATLAVARAAPLAGRKLLYTVAPRKVLTKADERVKS